MTTLRVQRPQIIQRPKCPKCYGYQVRCYSSKGSGKFKSIGYYKCLADKCGERFKVIRV